MLRFAFGRRVAVRADRLVLARLEMLLGENFVLARPVVAVLLLRSGLVRESFVLARFGLVLVRRGFVRVRLGDELLARRRLGVGGRAAESVCGPCLYQLVVCGEVREVSRLVVARVFGMLVARLGDRLEGLARRVCVRRKRRVLGLVAARLLARPLFVVPGFAAAEERADLADQIAYGLEGFRQDCVRANSARLRLVEWFERADEENEGDVPESRVAAHALAQLVPVRAGHVYVGEHDVGRLVRVERVERPLAVRDRDDLQPLVLERETDDLLNRRRVVCEEQFPASRKQERFSLCQGAIRPGGIRRSRTRRGDWMAGHVSRLPEISIRKPQIKPNTRAEGQSS